MRHVLRWLRHTALLDMLACMLLSISPARELRHLWLSCPARTGTAGAAVAKQRSCVVFSSCAEGRSQSLLS